MSGGRESYGQVKLAFNTVDGKQAICTRSMQLAIKKTARTFKTLEGNILIKDKTKSATVNSRCIDLDSDMPRLLGVSKAVLEYVIFCHQEDSLWPLAEPSIVKKRFDEIFEATKFTKALDNIKAIRKEYTSNIKVQEKDVQYLKTDRDRADKAKKRADQLVENIESFKEEAGALKKEMDLVTSKQSQLFDSNQEFQQVLYKLDQLRRDRKAYDENISRLVMTIDEMKEGDEELAKQLENFSERTDERRQKKLQMEEQNDKLSEELENERQVWNHRLTRQGQLKAQKTAHEENIKSHDEFIRKTVDNLDLNANDIDSADDLMYVLENSNSDVTRQLDKQRIEADAAETELSHNISQLSVEKSKQEQKKMDAKENIRENEVAVKELQRTLDALHMDEGVLEFENSKLADYREDLKAKQEKLAAWESTNKIGDEKKKKYEIEEELERLNRAFKQATSQAESRSKLAYYKKDRDHKLSALNKVKEIDRARYEKYVGKELDETAAEADLNTKLMEVQKQVTDQAKILERERYSLSGTETSLNLAKEERTKKKAEMNQLEKVLEGHLDELTMQHYQQRVEELKEYIESASSTMSGVDSMATYYRNGLKKVSTDDGSQKNHECMLCLRQFVSSDELKMYRQVLDREIKRMESSEELAQMDNEIQTSQKELDELSKIYPTIQKYTELKDRGIYDAESYVTNLEHERDDQNKHVEAEAEKLQVVQELLTELESLRKFSSDVARYYKETEALWLSIQDIEDDLGDGGSAGGDDDATKSAEEIHAELSKRSSELKAVDTAINNLKEEHEFLKNALQSCQTKITNQRLEISQAEQKLSDKRLKQATLEDLKEKQVKLKQEVAEASSNLEELSPQYDQLQQELLQLKQSNERKLQSLREQQSAISKAQFEMNQYIDLINKYSGDEELDTCEREMKDCSAKIEEIELRKKTLSEQISSEEKSMVDMKSHERELRDNLEIRRQRRELRNVEQEISQLEDKNAEQQKQEYEREVSKLQDKYTNLSSQYAGKMGEIRQMDDQLKSVDSELQSEFLDIHERYRKSVLQLATTTHANEDLARYAKALDTAIMKYHAMKMERINRTIDELWKRTYTGTDIDTICIKSDNENPTRGGRVYNYRVVMVKRDCELDMRGRCSAGQKVLASIIIRLALAETFGQNCGLIALDEPTTNLDSQNIEALAKAINTILGARSNQKNFQLVAITHDVEFLRHLSASSYVDHYYKVERNNRQSSTITQTDIHTIEE